MLSFSALQWAMAYLLLHSLPAILGVAVTIGVIVLILLWVAISVNKERTTIRRRLKHSGGSNRRQRRMEQAITRQRRKLH